MIKGKRTLSPESNSKIIAVFGLEEREAKYFNPANKSAAQKRGSFDMKSIAKFSFVGTAARSRRLKNPAQSRYFQDYRYALVYNALMALDFRGDYDQLSNFLFPPIPAGSFPKCVADPANGASWSATTRPGTG